MYNLIKICAFVKLAVSAAKSVSWIRERAADKLSERGISTRVINIHTIKPIDENIIIEAAIQTKAIITAEEHQITGGLGSAVAEVAVKNNPVPMAMIGMDDRFGESGQPEELMKKFGLTANNIVEKTISIL